MIELMLKMIFWLLSAMTLGFIVAWLLAKVFYQKKQSAQHDGLSAVIVERNNMVDKLEKKFHNQRVMFEKISDDLKYAEKDVAEKSSLLETLHNKLNTLNSSERESLELKRENLLCKHEIKKLKEVDSKRVKELKGFEEILLLAEKKIEENHESIKKLHAQNERQKYSLKGYKKHIDELQEELKLYASNSSDPEFVISKDQFVKIEEQLKEYQEKIDFLTNENNQLHLKMKKTKQEPDEILEEKAVDEVKREEDEGTMVKVFKETYHKITNS